MDDEKNVSTEPPCSQAPTRISRPHGKQGRAQGAGTPPGQGAQAPIGVTGRRSMVERLRKRRDFLAAAKSKKAAQRAFVLQARPRGDDNAPRFGFTISKRVAAKAVERNRIRRRLKEAVRQVAPHHARRGTDYVLIGRRAALNEPFTDIAAALHVALRETASPAAGAARSQAQRPR